MFVPLLLETPKNAPWPVSDKNFPQKRHSFIGIAQNQYFPQKRLSFIVQNQKFAPETTPAFATIGKTWNLIPRCQENAYYHLNFQISLPPRSPAAAAPPPCVPFFRGLHHRSRNPGPAPACTM
jgi:hypothetical protein